MVMYELLTFIIAFVILLKSADIFIDASVLLSKIWGFSQFFIGVTLVGIGTSLPELATSIFAALTHNAGLVLGNIIGSNITNTTLILGVASMVMALELKKDRFSLEVATLFAVTCLFFILSLDGQISWAEGLALIFLFFVYTLVEGKKLPGKEKQAEVLVDEITKGKKNLEHAEDYEKIIGEEIDYPTYRRLLHEGIDIKKAYKKSLQTSVTKHLFFALFSLAAVLISSKFLVSSATDLAKIIGVSNEVIGMTIIALGTSLPELSVVISCAKKGLVDVVIGNVIGSNIANILLVGGIAAMITPLNIGFFDRIITLPFMLLTTYIFLRFLRTKWLAKMLEGSMLIFFYCLFIAVVAIIAFL